MRLTPPTTDPATARVAAVIVTYDPDTDLSRTLTQLADQVTHVWIVDNGSEAGGARAGAGGGERGRRVRDPYRERYHRGLGAAQIKVSRRRWRRTWTGC